MTKPNNRWAIVYPHAIQYLWAKYKNADEVVINCKFIEKSQVRYIPKSAYHPVADGALE